MKTLISVLCTLAAASVFASDLDQARALLRENRLDDARAVLEKTVNDPALKSESLVLLTELYDAKGDYETAIKFGKQAVAALPASSEAHYEYAVALRIRLSKVGKLKAMMSIGDYRDEVAKAIQLDPKNVKAREEEVGFLLNAPGIAGGDTAKAKKKIEELKAIDWQRGARLEAAALGREEDRDGAVKILQEILVKFPEDHEARFSLAMTFYEAKRRADAERELQALTAVKEGPWALAATYQLARVRILGRYEQDRAVELLLDYIARVPENAQGLPNRSAAYWRLGNAYEQLAQRDSARKAYEKALSLDPGNKEAKKALASLPKG